MKKILLSPRLLLPLTILLGTLIISMHMADMWDMIASGRLTMQTAKAEDKPTVEPPPSIAPPAAATSAAAPPPAADTPVEPQMSAPPPDPDASPAELDVLKQLSDRREQLEKRARELDTREALLKVTEQRVDQKIKEMETLRLQLQSMVTQASEAQQAQIENLVKIYETMKPDEAARIFEKLDMPVLLGVIQKMKPKSSAPIMAKMAPEKAKEITDALTKQDQLPQIK